MLVTLALTSQLHLYIFFLHRLVPSPPSELRVQERGQDRIIVTWNLPLKPQGRVTRYKVGVSYDGLFKIETNDGKTDDLKFAHCVFHSRQTSRRYELFDPLPGVWTEIMKCKVPIQGIGPDVIRWKLSSRGLDHHASQFFWDLQFIFFNIKDTWKYSLW